MINDKGILVMIQCIPGAASKISRPVIPEHLAMALIATIHLKRNHPKASQILNILKSSFFIIKAASKIDQVLNNCLLCNADEFIHKQMKFYSTSEPPDHPYKNLSADVMKRCGSLVLVATDSLTSHTSTSLIKSEKSEDLELGLIKTILPFRPCNGTSKIRVDTAPGLRKLIRNPQNLSKYDIILDPGRVKNKNSLAIVDKRIRELEDEIRKLVPIDENTLVLATKFLNERVRQHGFSANELLFRRKQETHQELNLKDSDLKEKVFESRQQSHLLNSTLKAGTKQFTKLPEFSVGQIGFIRHEKSKHSVRPAYFVTSINHEKKLVTAKKMLHIHSKLPTKFQNISYEIKMADFIPAKSSLVSAAPNITELSPLQKLTKYPVQNDPDDSDDCLESEIESDDTAESQSETSDSEVNYEEEDSLDQDLTQNDIPPPLPNTRPQRAAKRAACEAKLWLENSDDEEDRSSDFREQIDGQIQTPDSTPETQNVNEISSHSTPSSSYSIRSSMNTLDWDNYASSPDLTGSFWEPPQQGSSPIVTQFYFNRKIASRAPIRRRKRF